MQKLDKKKLRSIPRPTVDEKIKAAAKKILTPKKEYFFATATKVPRTDILILNLYTKKKGAVYRVFLGRENYITQDLTVTNTKWLTGDIFSLCYREDIWTWRDDDYLILDDESQKLFDDWFKRNDNERNVLLVEELQEKIRAVKLEERYDREVEEAAKINSGMPKLPKIETWVQDVVLGKYNFLIYEPSDRVKTRGYCTICHNYVELDNRKDRKPRRDKKMICPKCHRKVILKPKCAALERGYGNGVVFQKFKDGFVQRYIVGYRDWFRHSVKGIEVDARTTYSENMRIYVYKSESGEWKYKIFYYGMYKTSHKERWYETDYLSPRSAMLYMRTFKHAVKGTPYQYCGLDILQKGLGDSPIASAKYIDKYRECRFLEYMVKRGLYRLTQDFLGDYFYLNVSGLNVDGRSLAEVLKISKQDVKNLAKQNGGRKELELYWVFREHGKSADPELVKEYFDVIGYNADEYLEVAFEHHIESKLPGYFRKMAKGNPKHFKNIADMWRDYLRISAELHFPLDDNYYLMPPDLKKAHNRVVKIKLERDKQREKERNRRMTALISKLKSEIDTSRMSTKKYIVVLPTSADDLINEGEHNHNCVGTYVERVAKKETLILFIRKRDDPKTPFYTLEWNNGRVIQCRGKYNVNAEGDIREFADKISRILRAQEEENDNAWNISKVG